jgi:hypothetical protein
MGEEISRLHFFVPVAVGRKLHHSSHPVADCGVPVSTMSTLSKRLSLAYRILLCADYCQCRIGGCSDGTYFCRREGYIRSPATAQLRGCSCRILIGLLHRYVFPDCLGTHPT